MNSELTRKLIERRIANNNEGIAAMDRDGISNHLQRELYDRWKQDNAIYEFALVGLSVQPRPIADAPKDERFIYAFHTIWKCWIAIRWDGEFWLEKTKTTRWPEDAFDCYVPVSSLPTPKDK